MKKIRILYIDDERHNLSAFRAAFRQKYEIYTAIGTLEARKILEEVDIHIIIADQRMPGATGIEFFDSIKQSYPDAIRILITAYTEVDALVDAINKGQIYRFIRKPWDYFDLQNTISNAYEIYTTKKRLDQKINELGKGQNELNRFITSMSKDLRAPVLSALGIVNLSKLDESISDIRNHIQIIEEKLLRVDGFIQRIVEYHNNTGMYPEYREIPFHTVIRDCVRSCNGRENIAFQIDVDQKNTFYGDLYRINIVLSNLISNAIKFSNPNADQPAVKLLATVGEKEAIIHVEDNGVGIMKDHLDKIFKLFYQSGDVNSVGSGIGLYIVKEAIMRMGGAISVFSTYEKGTKFVVTIPNYHLEK